MIITRIRIAIVMIIIVKKIITMTMCIYIRNNTLIMQQ
jgi:hypothetical protein